MNMVQKIGDIENPIGDLDTAVRALHRLADDMSEGGDDDTWCIVRMMANHLQDIHKRLWEEFDKAAHADDPINGPTLVS